MMKPMRPGPEGRAALNCKATEKGQQIFKPLGGLERSVREQAMESETHPQAATDPPENTRNHQTRPRKGPWREQDTDVQADKAQQNAPADSMAIQVFTVCFCEAGGCLGWTDLMLYLRRLQPEGARPRMVNIQKARRLNPRPTYPVR